MIVTGSSQNSIHLEVNCISNTNAKGAFITFTPVHPDEFKSWIQFAKIIPCGSDITDIAGVPFGAYKVIAYDIEKEGHLMIPIATPAAINTVVVSGPVTSKDIDNNFQNDLSLEIYVSINLSDLTLTVNCRIDDQNKRTTADSLIIALRSVNDPENLMVKVQDRASSEALVYSVKPHTNYTITVFTVNNSSILNSTTRSMEIYVGKFMK